VIVVSGEAANTRVIVCTPEQMVYADKAADPFNSEYPDVEAE
jgi:hypothetical protein